jgi:hypothetical protein
MVRHINLRQLVTIGPHTYSESFPTSGGGLKVEGEDGGGQVGDAGGAAAVAA